MKPMIPVIFLLLSIPLLSYATELNWRDVCEHDHVPYCADIGKDAHNNSTNPRLLQDIKLGKIIGIAWRSKGSVIGVAEAIPSAGIPEIIRTSPRDAYYYIIDDGSGKPFLCQCREIDAK